MPESKSHSLPNGRSRGDLAPARLPDPPRLPVLCLGALSFSGLPCSATTHRSRHQNGLTRLEGKGSCSYSHSLLFVFNVNGNSITASHRAQGGETWAVQGLQAGELCRCHHCHSTWGSNNSAVGSRCLGGVGYQSFGLTPRLFCLVPDF